MARKCRKAIISNEQPIPFASLVFAVGSGWSIGRTEEENTAQKTDEDLCKCSSAGSLAGYWQTHRLYY